MSKSHCTLKTEKKDCESVPAFFILNLIVLKSSSLKHDIIPLQKMMTSIYTLLVWVSVCLYPINVKTAEPIGPKICNPSRNPCGKVTEWPKF